MDESVRVVLALVVTTHLGLVMASCERRAPSAPPPPSAATAGASAAIRAIWARGTVPPEECDPTIAMSDSLAPFLGEWVSIDDPETAPLVVRESTPGIVEIAYPVSEQMRCLVTNVRLESGVLVFETVTYWDADGFNPIGGVEGVPMRTELHRLDESPERLELRLEPEANLVEPVLMRRAGPPEGDGVNQGDPE